MSQAASLRELHLELAAAQVSSADLAALILLPALNCLSIVVNEDDMEEWGDRGVRMIRTLAQMPALQQLRFAGNPFAQGAIHPTVEQLVALQSSTLQQMRIDMDSVTNGTLALGRLPALLSCELSWELDLGERELRVTAGSFRHANGVTKLALSGHQPLLLEPRCFSGLSALEELSIRGWGLQTVPAALSGTGHTLRRLDLSYNRELQLQPGSFSRFSVLEELSLRRCGLAAVPAALSGVGRTLRRLDLGDNEQLQIDQAGFDTLLALPALKWLSLCGPKCSTAPKLHWSDVSTRFLIKLHFEWQKLHPGASLPELVV